MHIWLGTCCLGYRLERTFLVVAVYYLLPVPLPAWWFKCACVCVCVYIPWFVLQIAPFSLPPFHSLILSLLLLSCITSSNSSCSGKTFNHPHHSLSRTLFLSFVSVTFSSSYIPLCATDLMWYLSWFRPVEVDVLACVMLLMNDKERTDVTRGNWGSSLHLSCGFTYCVHASSMSLRSWFPETKNKGGGITADLTASVSHRQCLSWLFCQQEPWGKTQ